MPMIIRRFSPGTRRYATLLSTFLIWVFGAIWLVTSIPWVQSSAATYTPALQWDFRVIYAAFPVGALMIGIYALVLLVRQLRTSEPMELGHSDSETHLE